METAEEILDRCNREVERKRLLPIEDKLTEIYEKTTFIHKLSSIVHMFRWGYTDEEEILLAERNAWKSRVAKLKHELEQTRGSGEMADTPDLKSVEAKAS